MITRQSYWDAYCLYIDRCVKENWENDIDPVHYEMEWNHFLPRSMFGNWPIGQYLTIRQHAIASALQTLAFGQSCLCGWHKRSLPKILLDNAWPVFCDTSASNGKKGAELTNKEKNEKGRSVQGVKNAKRLHKEKDETGRSVNATKGGVTTKQRTQKRTELIRICDGSVFSFDCVSDAARSFNLDVSSIVKVCRGKRKTVGGYTARYLT